MALHVPGDAVGPVLVGGAVGQHAGHAFGILAQQRIVAAAAQAAPEFALDRVEVVFVEAVVGRHAGAPVAYQAGFLQLRQMGGYARLRQLGDGGELGDGQFLAGQQGQQADTGGVGEDLQPGGPSFQIHKYLPIAI